MPRRNQMLMEIKADDDGSVSVLRENTQAIDRMDNAARQTSEGLEQVNQQQQRMSLSGNRANMVLMDTGRIIQDLPYGFRGVANNIDPFISQLQRAKQQTGSWKGVLSGLGSALMGPAGIATAVSAATSLIVSFGPQIADFFNIFDEGAKKVKDASDEMESFLGQETQMLLDKLGQIDKFQAEGPFDPTMLNEQIRLVSQTLDSLPDELSEKQEQRLRDLRIKLGQQGLTDAESTELAELRALEAQANQYAEERAELQAKENKLINERLMMARASNTEQGKRIQKLYEEQKRQEELAKIEESRLQAKKQLAKARAAEMPEDVIIEEDIDLSLEEQGSQLSFSEMAGATEKQRQALMKYNEELARSNALTKEHADKMLMQYESGQMLGKMLEKLAEQSLITFGQVMGKALAGNLKEGEAIDQFKIMIADFMQFFGSALIALGVGSQRFRELISNPWAAIAAGTVLVAAASAVKSSAQSRIDNMAGGRGGGGRGGTQNVLGGYRGIDASADNSDRPRDTGPVRIQITNGMGNIVAEGQMENDRNGRSNYLRGG